VEQLKNLEKHRNFSITGTAQSISFYHRSLPKNIHDRIFLFDLLGKQQMHFFFANKSCDFKKHAFIKFWLIK